MNTEDIENDIKRQLGLSLSGLLTGTAPLDVSQSPEKEKQSQSDGGKKKHSKTKHSNIRVETTSCQVMRPGEREALNRVKDEAVLELESEKRRRDFQVSDHARKFLEGNKFSTKSLLFSKMSFCRREVYLFPGGEKCQVPAGQVVL